MRCVCFYGALRIWKRIGGTIKIKWCGLWPHFYVETPNYIIHYIWLKNNDIKMLKWHCKYKRIVNQPIFDELV